MIIESINPLIEMAGVKSKAKKEVSPEKLREVYEARFRTLAGSAQVTLAEYTAKLADGTFDDKDGEPVGSGDERKEAMQKAIEGKVERVESMKAIIESGQDIPSVATTIEAEYAYTNPQTKKVEKRESITIDFEQKIQEFLDFYVTTGIDVPPDFREKAEDIWERNADEIQKAIQEKGFDEVLVVPADLNLTDLSKKMKMENGYADYIKSGGATVADLSGVPIVTTGADTPRIILVHKSQNLADHPELLLTKGKKAQDFNPDQSLSLDDYLIFQKKYHQETGKYLDKDGWTWLLKSKAGTRFVCGRWNPTDGKLYVYANDAGGSDPGLGCRPSRYFI